MSQGPLPPVIGVKPNQVAPLPPPLGAPESAPAPPAWTGLLAPPAQGTHLLAPVPQPPLLPPPLARQQASLPVLPQASQQQATPAPHTNQQPSQPALHLGTQLVLQPPAQLPPVAAFTPGTALQQAPQAVVNPFGSTATTPLLNPGSPASHPQLPPQPAYGPLCSHASEVLHPQDGPPVEQYIPFRYPDLRDQLIDDFPKAFPSKDTTNKFFRLCRWLSARNTLRLTLMYGDVKDKYAFVDPDNDAEDPGAGIIDPAEKRTMQNDFEREFLSVLDKGEFDAVTGEALAHCHEAQGAKGLEVEPVSAQLIRSQFWFRGQRSKTVKYKSWKTWFRTKEVETMVYQRLALCYSLQPEDQVHTYLEQKRIRTWGNCLWSCFRTWCKCFWSKGVSIGDNIKVEPGYVYLKLFKDVDLADLDMLLPGATAKFTWFDMLMIWVPIIVGVGMAIYKAATGTLDFDSTTNILLSLVLVAMPLTWGFKAYLAVKDKMSEYQAYLNDLCLTHNLDNNAGVVSGVLDEAQEQEDNESMLAYFFLWRGLKAPTPVRKLDLDIAVEDYLNQLIKKQKLEVRLDFEVCDSISKLELMGLLTVTRDPTSGHTMLTVLSLDEALEQAHVKNFDEKKEVAGNRTMGRLTAASLAASGLPPWRECEAVYPSTGQKFRYFYNVETGESTYTPPSSFLPYYGAASAPQLTDSAPTTPGAAQPAMLQAPVLQSMKPQ